ncbi:MAG TPA: LytTR family DNA-binding domain-containing protein [Actinoplanes sp.]|nr:LytTR family DNA-binding domain-containing protein [Actinoplanes sp.]
MTDEAFLTVLAIDDDKTALDDMVRLLDADPRVFAAYCAGDASEALRVLRDTEVDAVLLNPRMPGLDGTKLARALRRFSRPPAIVVVVSAPDAGPAQHFALGITADLHRPVRAEALAEALGQVAATRTTPAPSAVSQPVDEVTIQVEVAGAVRLLHRSAVQWVQADGEHSRLHTADGAHLVRVSLEALAQQWAPAGFTRIHPAHLVPMRLISELQVTPAGYVVTVGDTQLPVAARQVRPLKNALLRAARRGRPG